MNHKLTVVIMNWARPHNVHRVVPQYAAHKAVARTIVWDPGPKTLDTRWPTINQVPFDRVGFVTYVRSYEDLGLYARYAMAALAPTEAVLIVDDDIELPAATIDSLFDAWLHDGRVVHGIFGRSPTADGTYSVGQYAHGPCEVLLTRALVTSRYLCARALAHGTRIVSELPGVPLGNGEDIVLSYTAMAESGRMNQAHNLPFTNKDYDDANAISVRYLDHEKHRSEVVRWCRKHIMGWRRTA